MAPAFRAVALCVAAVLAQGTPARAETVAEFYSGRVVTIFSGLSQSGAYSAYAQTLKAHIGKFIPGNPTVIVQFKPGGTGRVLANWLYHAAPRDGTVFGTFHERIGLEPKFGVPGVRFDGRKFSWIGSASTQKSVCTTWHGSRVKRLDDALAAESYVGADAVAATGAVMTRMMNRMLGTKFHLVLGYYAQEIFLAMERGELDGVCGFGWAGLKAAKPDFVRDGRLNLLMQFGLRSHPELTHVPLMIDYVTDSDSRQVLELVFGTQEMGRPYAGPPGLPPGRLIALRRAFDATMSDADFLVMAHRRNQEIDPMTGEEIDALLDRLYRVPDALAQRVAEFRKPMKGNESVRTIQWVKVKAPLVEVVDSGGHIEFMVAGERHRAKVYEGRTEVKIGGLAAARSRLSKGMDCEIVYPGNFGEARAVACR